MHQSALRGNKKPTGKQAQAKNVLTDDAPNDQLSSVDNQGRIAIIQPKLEQKKQENALLQKEIEEREAKFLKREKEYREILAELQAQIKLRVEFSEEGTKKMEDQRKELNEKILRNIDSIQSKTTNVLAEQEKDIIRFYNTKIKELQQQFEDQNKEQGKK
jgi:hypothetical protein